MLFIFYLLFFSGSISYAKHPGFPKFYKELYVRDMSHQLDDLYLAQVEAQLSQYSFPVRAIFLPETQGVGLATYAKSLYQHWKLPPDTMLMVVALDREKIGVHMGAGLQQRLSEREPSKEINLSKKTKKPGDKSSPPEKISYLEQLPNVVEDLSRSLSQEETKPSSKPSAKKSVSSPLTDSGGLESSKVVSSNKGSRVTKPVTIRWQDFYILFLLFFVFVFGAVAWYGFKFWKKWKANQAFIEKHSLNSQVVYGELERIYDEFEDLMPSFHGYKGETHKKLSMFVKNMTQIQDRYDDIFDDFDDEVKNLQGKEGLAEAVEFFHELEQKRDEGASLKEQAELVIENLKEISDNNQRLLKQAEAQTELFKKHLHETKKLHPRLKFSNLYQILKTYHEQLLRFERSNAKDPMGVEKAIKKCLKNLSKLEREARALPHLWQQFDLDIKQRIAVLSARSRDGDLSLDQTKQLKEVQKLYQLLTQAIIQGDLKVLDQVNTRFTQALQTLEL